MRRLTKAEALAITKKLWKMGKAAYGEYQKNPGAKYHRYKFYSFMNKLPNLELGSCAWEKMMARAYEHLESLKEMDAETPVSKTSPLKRNPPVGEYSPLPTHCDLCHQKLCRGPEYTFVDGKTTMGPWAIMCERCYIAYGTGLGKGKGQQYSCESGKKIQG